VASHRSEIKLSVRELDVLTLIVEGQSNEQIAIQLFITVNTVKTHVSNIYNKLGLSNRVQVATFAIRSHLVE
jgi:two-component system, NarL family, response regulator LiaR